MKKFLLALIVALGFCGSIVAQSYDSHWPDFYGPAFMFQSPCVAAIELNGDIITADYPGWDAFEVAFFVGDECRGAGSTFPEAVPFVYYLYNGYVEEYGDPFPVIDGAAVYYDNTGEEVSVKIFDHLNGIEYDVTVTYLGEPFTIITGDDNMQGWIDPENPIIFSISGDVPPTPEPQTFTKFIEGYGDQSNPGGYYLIASPLADAVTPDDVNHMKDNEFDLYYFNQDVNDDHPWINYRLEDEVSFDEEFTLVAGMGYLYANSEDVTLEFTGNPYDGDGLITLDYVAGKPYEGWNLIGNPFAETAYLLTEDESDYVDFYILDGTEFRMATEVESYVDEMCGVLVEATPDLLTVKFDIDGKKVNHHALNMTLTRGGNVMDVARLRFNNGRGLHKFQLNPSSTKVYFTMDNEDYAVVNAPEMGEMPVNFKAESNGSYTMSFSNENVEFNYLHLIDNMTGADVDLLVNPSYSFDANTTDYASRFKLVFATGNNSDDNFAFYSNGSFIISNEGEAVLQVVDVTGRILNNETINGSANVHVDAAPGVYMLRLINGDNVKVQKVVVK